jgi:hypothetical protein
MRPVSQPITISSGRLPGIGSGISNMGRCDISMGGVLSHMEGNGVASSMAKTVAEAIGLARQSNSRCR